MTASSYNSSNTVLPPYPHSSGTPLSTGSWAPWNYGANYTGGKRRTRKQRKSTKRFNRKSRNIRKSTKRR